MSGAPEFDQRTLQLRQARNPECNLPCKNTHHDKTRTILPGLIVVDPAMLTDGAPDPEAIWSQLRQVFDPEIPVNIVDLGLVYSMDVEKITEPEPGHRVNVAMTLTAPGCGMGPAIAEDAKSKILLVPGVSDADVRITWDPPWNQSMISEEGKMKLGLI